MKVAITFILILVVGAAAAGYFYMNKTAAANASVSLPTAAVTRQTLEKTVTANGKVASNRDVDIKCQASGRVINMPFDVSAKVKVGDLLMELDPTDQQRSRDQANAQVAASTARYEESKVNYKIAEMNVETSTQKVDADLASAKAKAKDAKAKADRLKQLFASQLASPEELETAQTTSAQAEASVKSNEAIQAELEQQKISLAAKKQEIATAKAQLDQDNSKLDLAERQLEYCKVYVPDDDASKIADYRISSIPTGVQVGTIVQSGSSGFSGGTTVMSLSDVSHMYVLASVDESDIGQISDPARGGEVQKARVEVDAYPGVIFEGEVNRVAPKGVNTSNVVTFEVKIEVTSPNRVLLRPEMTAQAKIVIASRPDALSIPTSAFVRTPPPDRGSASTEPGADTRDSREGDPVASAGQGEGSTTGPAAGPTTRRAGRGGGRGGRGGRGGGGGGGAAWNPAGGVAKVVPTNGTVTIVKDNGSQEQRPVTVGLMTDDNYEVISGVEEGENVAINRNSGDSRWRNQNRGGNNNIMPRGLGGGGGGGRRG